MIPWAAGNNGSAAHMLSQEFELEALGSAPVWTGSLTQLLENAGGLAPEDVVVR